MGTTFYLMSIYYVHCYSTRCAQIVRFVFHSGELSIFLFISEVNLHRLGTIGRGQAPVLDMLLVGCTSCEYTTALCVWVLKHCQCGRKTLFSFVRRLNPYSRP